MSRGKIYKISALFAGLLLAISCLLFIRLPEEAKALTADELLSGDNVTVTQNAKLPGYMEKIWWDGETYDADELTAVRIETDGTTSAAKVTYNKVIDLSDCDADSHLFDFIIAPANGREFNDAVASVTVADYEFRSFQITLTDIYDSSNYVTLDFERRQDFWYYGSIRVSAPGQASAGWVESSQAMRQTPYGTPLVSSFTGCPADAEGNYGIISTFFDYAARTVYAQPYSTNKSKTLVRDLDDSFYLVPGDTALWNGFTTGEVNLTFEFQAINESTRAAIYLFSLNGQDMTGEEIIDTTPPVIKTSDDNLASGVPEAEVSRPYKIFNVSAYDALDGKFDAADIDVKVLKPDGKTTVSIDTNGCFTPDETGIYSIVWNAEDSAGNNGEYVLEVTVRGKLADLQVAVADENLKDTYSVGESVPIPQNISVKGGSGAYKTEITVINCATGDELSTANNAVIFAEQGYYAIVYRAEDYIGNVCVEKYFILAEGRSQPYVVLPSMPAAVLVDKPFTFPTYSALDYNSYAGQPVAANKYFEVSVDDWKTSEKYLEGEVFTPTAAGIVKYRVCAENIADPSQKFISEEASFAVVEPENIGEYLYDAEGEVVADYSASSDYPRYVSEHATNLEFINQLSVSNFYFTYIVKEEYGDFSLMELEFRDSVDAAQTATLGIYKKDDTNTEIFLDGVSAFTLNTPFVGTEFEVYFSNGYAYVNSTLMGQLGGTEDMFSSGLIYMTVRLKEVETKAGFELHRVNNQTYVGLYGEGENFDITAPVVVPSADIEQIKYVGDTIFVPSAKAYDVLDPVSQISLRIVRNKEEIYSSASGAEGTVIYADVPGEYTIIYTATDSSGNSVNASYTVRVYHHSDPVLTVNGTFPAEAEVGTSISVPQAGAKDYAGNSLTVYVYLIDANNVMTEIADSFTPDKSGTYIVRYYCYDSFGCYTIRDYSITVRGEK